MHEVEMEFIQRLADLKRNTWENYRGAIHTQKGRFSKGNLPKIGRICRVRTADSSFLEGRIAPTWKIQPDCAGHGDRQADKSSGSDAIAQRARGQGPIPSADHVMPTSPSWKPIHWKNFKQLARLDKQEIVDAAGYIIKPFLDYDKEMESTPPAADVELSDTHIMLSWGLMALAAGRANPQPWLDNALGNTDLSVPVFPAGQYILPLTMAIFSVDGVLVA